MGLPMSSSTVIRICGLSLVLVVVGCGSKSSPPPKDAAVEKTPDAGKPDAGDAPVETVVDAPAEMPVDAPAEMSVDAPAEMSADAPAEKAVDAAAEMAAEVSLDVAVEVAAEVGADVPPEVGPSNARLVYNTGVDSNGVVLAGGSVDPHYTLIQSAETTLPGPNAIVVSQIASGYWLPDSDTSKWLAPSANQSYPGANPCNNAGTYVYRTTFDLTGRDPSALRIDGKWAADNSGVAVRLNNVSLGITAPGYNPLSPFTISSGFVAGKNTLDFEILDTGCPNGLRVELTATFVTDASADASDATSGQ
jgi:hypothetical protein